MKQCAKCQQAKPFEAFGKHGIMPDGLRTTCKACVSAYNAQYRVAKGEDLKAAKRAYGRRNAEAISVQRAEFRRLNAERLKEERAAHYRANAEKRKAAVMQYQAKNQDAVRGYKRKHKSLNRDASNAHGARRRAAKRNATPAWANDTRIKEFYFAADLLSMVTGEWHHVDHVVPIMGKTVCGLHVEHNLAVLTGPENQRKGNRYWPDMP